MLTYKDIQPYIEKGLISERSHPEDSNVRIFNYTPECQFSREWDEVTMQCRGLIMNIETGEILARPFRKFFNYEEHIAAGKSLPAENPVITEKLDGSLGIMYTLNGKTWIATRGSFESEQAIWATDWWRKEKGPEPYGNDITYLFEIIYPENRIVVNYDFSGLVHIASIDTKTGKDAIFHLSMPVKSAKEYKYSDISKLSALNEKNSEGFVVFYPDADLRLKIKFPDYVRLHKIVTGLSEIGIWEALKEKRIDELLKNIPDEMYRWFSDVRKRIFDKYEMIELIAKGDYHEIGKEVNLHTADCRKDFALQAVKCKYPGILFAMFDKKDYSQMIWKMIRPHGQRTFKVDTDA